MQPDVPIVGDDLTAILEVLGEHFGDDEAIPIELFSQYFHDDDKVGETNSTMRDLILQAEYTRSGAEEEYSEERLNDFAEEMLEPFGSQPLEMYEEHNLMYPAEYIDTPESFETRQARLTREWEASETLVSSTGESYPRWHTYEVIALESAGFEADADMTRTTVSPEQYRDTLEGLRQGNRRRPSSRQIIIRQRVDLPSGHHVLVWGSPGIMMASFNRAYDKAFGSK
jgi:hypothetical protein